MGTWQINTSNSIRTWNAISQINVAAYVPNDYTTLEKNNEIKTRSVTALVLVGSSWFLCIWKAGDLSFQTTPKSARINQYTCDWEAPFDFTSIRKNRVAFSPFMPKKIILETWGILTNLKLFFSVCAGYHNHFLFEVPTIVSVQRINFLFVARCWEWSSLRRWVWD